MCSVSFYISAERTTYIMRKNKKTRFKRIKWPWANRKYKDTVFRYAFKNDKKALLELYNAINHSHYDNPDDLIINTIDNAIYIGMHNDLSFILDTHLNIYEHQSTKGTNIPLRCLFYVSTLYSQTCMKTVPNPLTLNLR